MSRVVTKDFAELRNFFAKYSIAANLGNGEFVKFLSIYHKKYLAYLTYIAEISTYKTKKTLSGMLENQFDFFSESCSDCGLALFDSVNGNYKAAKLLLRSSIENFMKAIALEEDNSIDQESSVFKLFERVKAIAFFSKAETKSLFNEIHQEYKELCKDVHTATTANMIKLSALKTFPSFDQNQADRLLKIVIVLITSYITLLALKYNKHYHSIGFLNKEVIENGVRLEYADAINNKK